MRRGNLGQLYYYLCSDPRGAVIKIEESYDYNHLIDNARFEKGNYFLNKAGAMRGAQVIIEILKKAKDRQDDEVINVMLKGIHE